MPATRPVGILGGMGPAAGADFVRLFVAACTDRLRATGLPACDQAYPAHCLVQLPVPDRSAALASPVAAQPLDAMKQAMQGLRAMGASGVAIACNTAHAWHGDLQAAFPDTTILNVMDEVAGELQRRGVSIVGLLATEGTYRSGLYQEALSRRGILCAAPDSQERQDLMDGIYQGVKAGRFAHGAVLFERVARSVIARHKLPALILGCTEIPLAFPAHSVLGVHLIDPAQVLAHRLAAWAYEAPAP